MTDRRKTAEEEAATVVETMAQLQKMGLDSMSWMGSDWFERMSAMGSEALRFMSERVQRDVDLRHRLLHTDDAEELRKVQAEFVQTAIDDYTAETGKLMEMGMSLFQPPGDGD